MTTSLDNEIRPPVPVGYAELLTDLNKSIQTAQFRASLSMKRELVLLYRKLEKNAEKTRGLISAHCCIV